MGRRGYGAKFRIVGIEVKALSYKYIYIYYYFGAKRTKEPKKGELLSSKANQAEAHVDVVGLAAAATNKGQKADVEGESG